MTGKEAEGELASLRARAEKAEVELAELRRFAEEMAVCLDQGQQCLECPAFYPCGPVPPHVRYRARCPEETR